MLKYILRNIIFFQISPGRIKYQLVSKNHILKNKMNLWMSNNPWSGLCKRVHWLFAGRHDVWLPRLKFAWLSNKGGFKLMLGLENPSLGSGDLKRESHGLFLEPKECISWKVQWNKSHVAHWEMWGHVMTINKLYPTSDCIIWNAFGTFTYGFVQTISLQQAVGPSWSLIGFFLLSQGP